MQTIAILPVKGFPKAKQRLAAKVSGTARQSLAEAMFRDVLAALESSRAVDGILVITGGEGPRQIAGQHGVPVIEDEERGHNEAARIGIAAGLRAGAGRALLVPGDCPALEAGEINELLARRVPTPSALIVPDRHGTGTNALVLTPPDALAPSFGPGSCRRHLADAVAAGLHAEVVRIASLSTDVDTREDLEALGATLAAANGAAARTRQLLTRLSLFPES